MLSKQYFNVQYDEVLNMPCVVRSSNLVQELGMVSNVFSDKTGTLTRNEMRFVKFIIDGNLYDMDSPIAVADEKNGGGGKQFSPAEKGDYPVSSAQSAVTALLAAPGGKQTKVSITDLPVCFISFRTIYSPKIILFCC